MERNGFLQNVNFCWDFMKWRGNKPFIDGRYQLKLPKLITNVFLYYLFFKILFMMTHHSFSYINQTVKWWSWGKLRLTRNGENETVEITLLIAVPSPCGCSLVPSSGHSGHWCHPGQPFGFPLSLVLNLILCHFLSDSRRT